MTRLTSFGQGQGLAFLDSLKLRERILKIPIGGPKKTAIYRKKSILLFLYGSLLCLCGTIIGHTFFGEHIYIVIFSHKNFEN
jgi:hypothetical protein